MEPTSESIKLLEKDIEISKMIFEKEYLNYNYTFNVCSESISLPIISFLRPLDQTNNLKHQLAIAAKALYSDYIEDKELTIYTSIDSEDFYEQK